MKKIKVFSTKNYDMFKTQFGSEQKIELETKQAEERIRNGNPAFHCKKCNSSFAPNRHQWIFYLLCDSCFAKFDQQKMMGRTAMLKKENSVKYFEDSDEWIKEVIN
jgi:Zn finger protein HypA/HybF involved in hydrogenase expression